MSAFLASLSPWYKTVRNGSDKVFILFIALVVVSSLLTATMATAQVLTPPSGVTVIARQPETHLVLRQQSGERMIRVQIGDSIRWLDPVVSLEGADGIYRHYRLPLQPGNNVFRLQPTEEEILIEYQRVQSELSLRSRSKNVYFFHQDEQLPEDCRDCHDLISGRVDSTSGLARQDSCMSCHSSQIGKKRWQHSSTVNRQCLSCHDQPESDRLVGMPKSPLRDRCFSCHTGKRDWPDKKVVHGPLNLGSCTLCHAPHGGDYRYQLWADSEIDLCLACHSNMAQLVTAIREHKIPYVHNVLTGPGCVACHDPHATDQIYMLKKPINELCSGCHPGPAAAGGHPVARHPVEGPREGLRPNRTLSCTSCHEPHGSYNRYLLIEPSMGGRLCRECHRQ